MSTFSACQTKLFVETFFEVNVVIESSKTIGNRLMVNLSEQVSMSDSHRQLVSNCHDKLDFALGPFSRLLTLVHHEQTKQTIFVRQRSSYKRLGTDQIDKRLKWNTTTILSSIMYYCNWNFLHCS